MRARAMVQATVVIGSLVSLAVAGCATGGGMGKMSADEAIEKRKALMKEQGAAWRSVQDKAKAGQVAAIAADAEKLASTAKQIPPLFPEGSLAPAKSAAKPEIWQKRAEFDAAAKNMETLSLQLRDAARANNGTQVQALVKDYGRMACGTCHTPFRVPPKQ
jgi:cytochrome c556